jgi:hypothetical protein
VSSEFFLTNFVPILTRNWEFFGIFFLGVNSTNFYNMLGKNCQFFKITPKTKQKQKPCLWGVSCMHLCKSNIYNYLLKEILILIICCLGQEGALNFWVSCFGIQVCMSNFTLVKLITNPAPTFPISISFLHIPQDCSTNIRQKTNCHSSPLWLVTFPNFSFSAHALSVEHSVVPLTLSVVWVKWNTHLNLFGPSFVFFELALSEPAPTCA